MIKKTLLYFLVAASFLNSATYAQDDVSYKLPPKEIADLLLAKPTPSININDKAEWILFSERDSYPSVEELAMPEYRIAGLRLNPANFSLSRQYFINNLSLKNFKSGQMYPIIGLPNPLSASNISWNPAENKIAFTNTTTNGVDLYTIDIATKKAVKINKQYLNVVLGADIIWLNDQTLLYTVITKPASAAPVKPLKPKGPTVQQSLGKVAPSPTYQDLIKSPFDESLFEFFATSQMVKNTNGVESLLGKPALYNSLSLSPDKKYLLVNTIRKPFSYLVTAGGFPSTISIQDLNGKTVKVLVELPSREGTPSGNDNLQNVPRSFDWRDDEAATITWSKSLDGGLIKTEVPYHDAVYALSAPFTGAEKELFKTEMRYRGVEWGTADLALVMEGLRSKQTSKVSRYNPTTGVIEELYSRNQTDAYGDPGSPVTTKNKFGRAVITLVDNNSKILMNNRTGASDKGDLPFLAKFDLSTKTNEIIWRCPEGTFEYVSEVIDPSKLILVTRRESQKMVPNYFVKNLSAKIADVQLTNFTNPYPSLEGISKEKISYKRADGIDLTGDLYLPKGYDKVKDGPLPTLIWAYPREFNSAADAAQVRGSENKFTTISWASPIYWVTRGYAILDNAEMPIVAQDGKKPNDTFVEQLQQNAIAAIDKLAGMGVSDRKRIAVGGHSYGAFMTTNLLAHTNLFAAGIARSGAYNRTLTPFGFQNEDRTYWQAPDLYHDMSPFSYADKIKTPLLLIHGDSDDNTGTYPINSERLFAAIKGLGGTVRFTFLPYEAHSYRGRENLLHMLWEQDTWLETYVKNKK
jgi:dipeptidyl aminopeptidase/acylaminoacyl peptidase